ncbi:hypothetical protein [Lentzea californiensis]|uniref:hypothetical protein n=1 Tax=Lentzea californiensis TaxID=438851 RepID=UPI00216492D7|nr:hypothetical protein [Lentzea californiensis]
MTGPRTTWCSAQLDVEHTGRENLQFNRTGEPHWTTPPPPEAYQEELRRAGSAGVLPDWLRARLDQHSGASASAPARGGPGLVRRAGNN